MKRIGDLPHGDVVCVVTMAKDGKCVFTGGKGTVKVWDIRDRIDGVSAALLNSSSANSLSGDSIYNGGPASAEPWAPVHTFQV
jgi:WD40 repeat protein